MSIPNAEPTAEQADLSADRVGSTPPGPAGDVAKATRRRLFGGPVQEDDRPLPDLPPLPTDPRWRIEHLPMVSAAGATLVLCAGSVGFFARGPAAALGAAAGVLVVALSLTMSTLVIAWADAVRPALILPAGLLTYVIKFALIAFIMLRVSASGWSGGRPMAWGIAGGVVVLTAVQVWWVSRLARRNAVTDRRDG